MVCQLDAHDIKLIATDVDGTLLNHKQELTERTARAFQTAASLGIKVRCSLLHNTRACRLCEVTKYITVVRGTTGNTGVCWSSGGGGDRQSEGAMGRDPPAHGATRRWRLHTGAQGLVSQLLDAHAVGTRVHVPPGPISRSCWYLRGTGTSAQQLDMIRVRWLVVVYKTEQLPSKLACSRRA